MSNIKYLYYFFNLKTGLNWDNQFSDFNKPKIESKFQFPYYFNSITKPILRLAYLFGSVYDSNAELIFSFLDYF